MMVRRLLPLALFFVASAALAQLPADLSVSIVADPTVDGNQKIDFQIDVANNGPSYAQQLKISGGDDVPNTGGCLVFLDFILPNTHALIPCSGASPFADRDVVLHAQVSAATDDPNLANNITTRTVHAVGGPELSIGLSVPPITPAIPFGISASYTNHSLTNAATGAVVTFGIPSALHVVAVPDGCSQSDGVVTCAAGTVPAQATATTVITAVADEADGGTFFDFTADIKENEPESVTANNHAAAKSQAFLTFFVTDTTDSLADAIDRANHDCASGSLPCKIAFRLGAPAASGYFTVKPHRALPPITGKYVFVDGSTQTQLTGDTNPNGPEVFIDGSENEWEDAIVFDGTSEAGFVAIGNFRNAAVTMLGNASVHDCYLGVDPTGTHAAPNGRGVVISESASGATVTNNLISGNLRSGIWMGVAKGASITGNTIGLDIHHQPLGNGASGIFAGPLVTDLSITNNYVAFNHDFGIAIDRRAAGVNLMANSIFANWQLGIDVGLDGPTPDRDIPAPVIVSAQYDAAHDKTVVVLSVHEPNLLVNPTAALYASDAPHPSGYGDGQYFLGKLDFDPRNGGVTMTANGDWRGKWVAATVTRNDYFAVTIGHLTTSEFSRAVKVE